MCGTFERVLVDELLQQHYNCVSNHGSHNSHKTSHDQLEMCGRIDVQTDTGQLWLAFDL